MDRVKSLGCARGSLEVLSLSWGPIPKLGGKTFLFTNTGISNVLKNNRIKSFDVTELEETGGGWVVKSVPSGNQEGQLHAAGQGRECRVSTHPESFINVHATFGPVLAP